MCLFVCRLSVCLIVRIILLVRVPWPCLSCLALLTFASVACRAWRCSALLALLVVLGVFQRCLCFVRCYLALLGFVDVACLAWHCLALLGTAWHCFALLRVACLAWPRRLTVQVALVRFSTLNALSPISFRPALGLAVD